MDDRPHVVILRRARDPLLQDYRLGYNCSVCQEPLQVSPAGVQAIAGGAVIVCNTCGFELAQRFLQEDPNHELEVRQSPGALEQLKERKKQ